CVGTPRTAPRIELLTTKHGPQTLSRDTRSHPRSCRAGSRRREGGARPVRKTAPPGAVCASRGPRAVFRMSAAAAPPAGRRRVQQRKPERSADGGEEVSGGAGKAGDVVEGSRAI